jgi:hypothetical protein
LRALLPKRKQHHTAYDHGGAENYPDAEEPIGAH